MKKHIITNEEKVAKQIENALSDVRLDLDLTGIYFARFAPSVSYNRLMLIAESAEFERESVDVRNINDDLF
jgi:hypothetical protein